LELHAAKAAGGTAPGSNDPLTTQWYDTSGNGNHGTLTNFTGTPWSADRLAFDGVNDRVTCGNPAACNDRAFSYEVWALTAVVRASRLLSESDHAVVVYDNAFALLGIGTDHKARFGFYNTCSPWGSGNYLNVLSTTSVDDGERHHIVGSADGTTMRVYVDGTIENSGTQPTGGLTVTEAMVGGLWLWGVYQSPFPGAIYLARIYPFALTPEQVAANYAAGLAWSGLPPHILRPVYYPRGAVNV